jgi:hypothetical protein
MSNRILYQDHAVALTSDAIVVKGFTKILGRSRRIELAGLTSFRLREQSEFPNGQMPPWGLNDEGAWYTKDRRRFKRHQAIEVTFVNGETVGFTPAHASRFRDLLLHQNITEK